MVCQTTTIIVFVQVFSWGHRKSARSVDGNGDRGSCAVWARKSIQARTAEQAAEKVGQRSLERALAKFLANLEDYTVQDLSDIGSAELSRWPFTRRFPLTIFCKTRPVCASKLFRILIGLIA
jgi:hypothetical protein